MKIAAVPSRPARRELSFVLAILLPPLSGWITAHTPQLQHIPFALYFLSTVFIAALGGLAPSMLAFAMVLCVSKGILLARHQPWGFGETDLLRYGVLLAAALAVSFISDGRRRSEERLKLAVAELQERTDDLAASLNSSKCACWTLDLSVPRSARWFSGSYPVFGRPFREIEELPSLLPLIHPEDQPGLLLLAQRMRTSTEPVLFEYRTPWPNGELHWMEMRGHRTPGPGCCWRGVTVDITERKLSEAALLRSEKLAAMGRLASTVAHEINNPLEAVTNLLYLAGTDVATPPQTRAYIATAERELARLSNITRLTLGFVRNSGSVTRTELAEVVDDVLYLFQHRLESRGGRVERDFQSGVAVLIAPHELRQIVTNLVANAADAVEPPDGCVRLRVFQEADCAVLLVEDNGSGIEAHLLERIFEPFFSTKGEIGTGIGLWVTRELVEKSGGRISVQSSVDPARGPSTAFRVEFPIAL